MYDGSFKHAEDICEGDALMSPSGEPTFVKKIRITPVRGEQTMVQLGDFYITKGHPIYHEGKKILLSLIHVIQVNGTDQMSCTLLAL